MSKLEVFCYLVAAAALAAAVIRLLPPNPGVDGTAILVGGLALILGVRERRARKRRTGAPAE